MASAIHISDAETCALIRQLTLHRGVTIVQAIRDAVAAALVATGQPLPQKRQREYTDEQRNLIADLSRELRESLRIYCHRRFEEGKSKSKSSRTYGHLNKYGPVECARRAINLGVADGLRFLVEHDLVEISFESIVLKPKYDSLFADAEGQATRRQAESNLAAARS